MAISFFSPRAEEDLVDIGDYTMHKWGEAQSDRYLSELQAYCERLATNPLLGRPCDHLQPNLRRSEHGKHVIFYRQVTTGILVARILHQSMLPQGHPLDDQQ